MKNHLQLTLAEFRSATRVFLPKRHKLGPALLAYEGGFLSIGSGEATAVMRAEGEWHGRATFSAEALRALATVPPSQNPLAIAYADSYLVFGSMRVSCQWQPVSQAFIHDLQNPGLLDLLAMERTLPRAEIGGTGLGRKIRSALEKYERRIRNAAAQLEELEVTEREIRALVEARIRSRIRG